MKGRDHMTEAEKMKSLLEKMTPKMAELLTGELNAMDATPEEKEMFNDYLEFIQTPEGARVFLETMNDPAEFMGDHYTKMIDNIEVLKETIRDLPNGGVLKAGDGENGIKEMFKVTGDRIKRRNQMIKNLEEIQAEIEHARGYFDRLEETIQTMKGRD